ncbi:glucose-1-phosphate adenylyltransferase [Salipaludibacillus aurantiacus]|uniref:Glucose-1-phosphate adenylyltransferase n=1 Tax=Salipaludibacillus aurantiacus TaxID=1601833 RepID=A0A1H9S7H6_9BACI|nr:glucose-1-phosphate adenylyltransferase [Salipaludibacillus aurantiacus]SER80129.1 glucose-1-phosphate adenylyltransferase [Salipaludibacillus aurantiacus]
MKKRSCVAMLLAGGKGTRLKELTMHNAKPAVPFGGKYRIIDFTLSNCQSSGIDTVGLLTQYSPHTLHNYIGRGEAWGLDRKHGGLSILPPYQCKDTSHWYEGTADAVYQNLHYIDQYDPEHVLIISGDHIYKMDYNRMLEHHIETNADATVSVKEVPWTEAGRFGIINTGDGNKIEEFNEKPDFPRSNLASMGVYIFKWSVLKRVLIEEEKNEFSSNDFGKDILPGMLHDRCALYAYRFNGYWKDVGTLESYWEANMDLLKKESNIFLANKEVEIMTVEQGYPPQYVDESAAVRQSLLSEGAEVYGAVDHSVLFTGVKVGKGAVVENSVVLPNAVIGEGARIENAIIGENVTIPDYYEVVSSGKDITLIGESIVEEKKLHSIR